MNKYQIFRIYYKMNLNPTEENKEYRNHLLNVIYHNGWLEEYTNTYENEFGI